MLERIQMLWRVEFFQNNIRATLIFSKSQVHCIIWAHHNKCTQWEKVIKVMNLCSNKTTLSDIQHSLLQAHPPAFHDPLLFNWTLSSSLHLIPNPWWVTCSVVFLFTTASRSLSLCSSFNPTPVLIIASPRLFMLPSVPWPKSSSIALTLCLIPPLVHAPPIYLSLFPLKERCTPFQFGTSSFFGAFRSPEQIWWSIFPLLTWTWRIPSLPTLCQPITTRSHFCTTTSVFQLFLWH